MSEAPKHIWTDVWRTALGSPRRSWVPHPDMATESSVEYIRADLVQAQIDAAVSAERERCMQLRTAADQERG